MTRDETRRLLPVMQAFSDGETVQVYDPTSDKWLDLDAPIWNPKAVHRIKPKPREVWIVGGGVRWELRVFGTEADAKAWLAAVSVNAPASNIQKFREVLD